MEDTEAYPQFFRWSGLPMIRLSERHWPAHHLNGKKIIFYDFHAFFTETMPISRTQFISMMIDEGCRGFLEGYGIEE